jgi:hypothetical protein
VHRPDLHTLDLDHAPFRQGGLQRFVIHVSRHRVHGAERAQLCERALCHDVACVQDEIGFRQEPNTLSRESANPARQVRIRDDCDERQRFLRLGFVLRAGFGLAGVATRNGLLTKTFVRAVFISAWSRVAST